MPPPHDQPPEVPSPVVAVATTGDFALPDGKAPRIEIGYSPAFNYEGLLGNIFEKAKSTDELEFVSTLLRIRGCEDPGWDPFLESQRAVWDFVKLIDQQEDNHTRARLSLLTYCHITEISGVYSVIANLLHVGMGDRYNMDPLGFLNASLPAGESFRPPLYPWKKIKLLEHLAQQAGFPSITAMFGTFFNKAVRNGFFHSDYTLHENKFRLGKLLPKRVYTLDEVRALASEALSFYAAFFNLFWGYAMSYKEEKIVQGRCGPSGQVENVRILVHEAGGLKGFQTPP